MLSADGPGYTTSVWQSSGEHMLGVARWGSRRRFLPAFLFGPFKDG